ncbi:MAG: hypothetical protein L0229_16210 [Blastocatellia bacterium]|nr:hypothetical protein [Blastocatellia bacterium]
MWLTAVGALIGILLLVVPSLVKQVLWIRLFVAIICSTLPLLIFVFIHSVKVLFVALERLRHYDYLYEAYEKATEEVQRAQEMILYLLRELTSGRRFEIEKVLYYDQEVYIIVGKKRGKGRKLEVGNNLIVMNLWNGTIMGKFEVSEVRQKDYRARNTGYISPVWLGYIHKSGASESSPPPDTAAIYIETREGDDDEHQANYYR